MANTYVDYTAVASQTDYNFSFEYLRDDHVKVKVDDVIVTNYTIVTSPTPTKIRFNTAPTAGAEIKIYRDSRGDFDPIVDFQDGSVLTQEPLDTAYLHNLYVAQETSEGVGGELLFKKDGINYDAEGDKIINLGTPGDSTDAANKGYVDQTIDNSIALGGSPAIVSLGGYDVTALGTSITKSLSNWTNDLNSPIATGSTTARTLADRFAQVAHVEDFGADNTGGSDSSTAIQAAIDSLPTAGDEGHGGILQFGVGKYKILTTLVVPEHVIVQGMGISATRLNCGTGVATFQFTGGGVSLTEPNGGGLSDMTISCDSVSGAVVDITDCWGFYVNRIRFRDGGSNGANYQIKCSGRSFEVDINQVRFAITGTPVSGDSACLYIADDCNNTYVRNCDFGPENGADSIHVEEANSVVIIGNHFEYAGGEGGVHIKVTDCLGTKIVNNQIGANELNGTHSIEILGTSSQTVIQGNRISLTEGALLMGGTSRGTLFDGNAVETSSTSSPSSSVDDVVDDGGRPDNIFSNNFFVNTSGAGIGAANYMLKITGSRTTVTGNIFKSVVASVSGTCLYIGGTAAQILVTGNIFDQFTTGIDCDATAGSHQVTISDNAFVTLSTDIDIAVDTAVRLTNNQGLATENRGTGSILSGNTSVTITHNLAFAPEDIIITPTTNPTNSVGTIFVSDINTTTFNVNCENQPGATNLPFKWTAKAY